MADLGKSTIVLVCDYSSKHRPHRRLVLTEDQDGLISPLFTGNVQERISAFDCLKMLRAVIYYFTSRYDAKQDHLEPCICKCGSETEVLDSSDLGDIDETTWYDLYCGSCDDSPRGPRCDTKREAIELGNKVFEACGWVWDG